MFGAFAWEFRPQIIVGVPAKKAHPWLIQLYDDLNEFALISPEFEDVRVNIKGNYTMLFDEKHEDETQQFIAIDVRIIRRAYHTVQIPPPSSLTDKKEEQQEQKEEENMQIVQEEPEATIYCCRVRIRGQYCKARLQSKRALLCHMRFQNKTCHLIKCMVKQTNAHTAEVHLQQSTQHNNTRYVVVSISFSCRCRLRSIRVRVGVGFFSFRLRVDCIRF